MRLPPRYRDILLSGMEPGEMYQKCMRELAREGRDMDYGCTETIVYATEVRYAIQVLTKGRPERLWNFGDLRGGADDRLWALLDPIRPRTFAFVGSGPYPVTAMLMRERYPDAEIACIDNNIVAHFLSEAVFAKLGLNIRTIFEDAIDADYRPFAAIVVAAMVSGKRDLVQKILQSSDARVILRGAVDLSHERLIQLGSEFRDDGAISGPRANPGAPR
jgi:hypothetical protein